MTSNRRADKKQHKANGSVKTADVAPAMSTAVEETAPLPTPVPVTDPGESLMTEVDLFLKCRDDLAKKLFAEIAATEKKLAELKKTAGSLFPEKLNGEEPTRKTKKNKDKSSGRNGRSEILIAKESSPPADASSSS